MSRDESEPAIPEITLLTELTGSESGAIEQLMSVPIGGECVIYFDCPGGSPYAGMAMLNLLLIREIRATAIVVGQCSSAAIWPFAACRRRIVTPYSVLLFHPSRWESEENVRVAEAAEWARHFADYEDRMDELVGELLGLSREKVRELMSPGKYLYGKDMVELGLAEMIEIGPQMQHPVPILRPRPTTTARPRPSSPRGRRS